MNKRKQEENWGYYPDEDYSDQVYGQCCEIYGADAIAELPYHPDSSAFPYRAAAKVLQSNPGFVDNEGRLRALNQGSVGSCVGFGSSRKLLVTIAAGIYLRGLELDWPVNDKGLPVGISASYAYGASRQVSNQLGRWDGSNGAWAADGFSKFGVLFMKQYSEKVDLSVYTAEQCKQFARKGVPPESRDFADDTLMRGKHRLSNVEEAVALLGAGYGINVCGPNKAKGVIRDENGELPTTGRRWAHSMSCVGYIAHKRKPGDWYRGFIILNSHGDKYRGGTHPLTPDLPKGAYVTSWREMEIAISRKDCWVSYELDGLRPPTRKWRSIIGTG